VLSFLRPAEYGDPLFDGTSRDERGEYSSAMMFSLAAHGAYGIEAIELIDTSK
jgi:hypothetical protein